jgi:hypothetical protein
MIGNTAQALLYFEISETIGDKYCYSVDDINYRNIEYKIDSIKKKRLLSKFEYDKMETVDSYGVQFIKE